MKLEDQICTPEQGQRLKDLGVVQFKSLYSQAWAGSDKQTQSSSRRAEYLVNTNDPANSMSPQRTMWGWGVICSRFTAAELGQVLAGIVKESTFGFETYPTNSGLHIVRVYNKGISERVFPSKHEAQSRAACLIWLLETKPELLQAANAIIED